VPATAGFRKGRLEFPYGESAPLVRAATSVARGKAHMPAQDRPPTADRLDDDHHPAYTMGRAAEVIGATPAFLRSLGEAGLITPMRSEGGHRRYSRHQLRLALRAREMVGQGTPVEAACRIIGLEVRLEDALRVTEELRRPDEEVDQDGE
jgi:DNA-binding transcriptional MerR regulator